MKPMLTLGQGYALGIPHFVRNDKLAGYLRRNVLASLTNGQRTVFEGFLTQQGACNQNRPCAGSNTPVDAWNQINNLLITNYPTNQSKIKMFYFTDICGSSGNRDMCGFTFEE